MVAEVEEQRVMIPGEKSWMEWRAVCYDHPTRDGEEFLPPWMATCSYLDWIDAKLDAVEHDALEHQISPVRKDPRSWEQIVHGVPEKVDLVADYAI